MLRISRDLFRLQVSTSPNSGLEPSQIIEIGPVSISKIGLIIALIPMSRACPPVLTLSVHFPILELPCVLRAISESHSALAFNFVLVILFAFDLSLVDMSSLELYLGP